MEDISQPKSLCLHLLSSSSNPELIKQENIVIYIYIYSFDLWMIFFKKNLIYFYILLKPFRIEYHFSKSGYQNKVPLLKMRQPGNQWSEDKLFLVNEKHK